MITTDILSAIDSEIAALQQVRALLAGQNGQTHRTIKPAKKTRIMSAEARKRIGDAQRKRWAKQKKAAKAT